MTGTRRSPRGPRNHCVTTPDAHMFERMYQWGPRGKPSPLPWTCSCGETGPDQATAEAHLHAKIKPAWARLDDGHAWAAAAVSDDASDRDAKFLLGVTRAFYAHPGIRRRLRPYYDRFGCIAAQVDWAGLVADVDAGELTGEDSDLLVLRIAASLAGVPVTLKLADLWRLPEDDTRNVRDALLKLLRVDGDP